MTGPGDSRSFVELEIECADEAAAQALAQHRQSVELDDSAEWIYLRNQQKKWVARRVSRWPSEPVEPEKGSWLNALFDNFLDGW